MHQTKSSLPDRHTTKYFVTNIMALLDRWEEGREGRDKVKHPKAGKRGAGGEQCEHQLIHVPDLLSVEDILQ